MDLAVNQEANILLYRLHDDLWLCGEPAKCAEAWTTIERCAKILGLQFNRSKTGSAYLTDDGHKDPRIRNSLPKGKVILGFLELEEQTGDWVIDHKRVDGISSNSADSSLSVPAYSRGSKPGTAVSDVSLITLSGSRQTALANVMWT